MNRAQSLQKGSPTVLLLLLSYLVLSSCTTHIAGGAGEAKSGSEGGAAVSAAEESGDSGRKSGGTAENGKAGDERLPAKSMEGGIDPRSEAFRQLSYTVPQNGRPLFMAAVPRRADREEEYEYALWEVARQAAMYRGVKVSAQFLTAQTSAEFGHDERIEIDLSGSVIEEMRTHVVPISHYRDAKMTLVQASVDAFSVPDYPVSKEVRRDLPVWVLNPPKIEGIYTTVGSAERRYYLGDSLRAADKKAMANLARQRRLKIDNLSDQLKSNAGAAYREFNLEITEAKLDGFYVLARWFSPEENLYYSLAVCSKAE